MGTAWRSTPRATPWCSARWSPQRLSVPGAETGDFRDLGHLNYGVVVATTTREYGCRGHYSDLSPSLTKRSGDPSDPALSMFALKDAAADAPADPANTLSFTVDLAGCLAANGQPSTGVTVDVQLTAAGEDRPGGNDRGTQTISVRLP